MHTAERTLSHDVPLPVSRTPEEKLRAIVLPGTTTFQGTSFYDALAYLRQESVRLDVEEADVQARGVPIWIVDGGAHCIAGKPGESKPLDRMVGHLFCHLEFVDLPLGYALHVLARCFGLEMQVAEKAVFLWLSGRKVISPALCALRSKLAAVRPLLLEDRSNST